ncbi:MAG: DegT/DnrJ/EryC1/StrS family aminotransferase [Geminicoccales bacterium]
MYIVGQEEIDAIAEVIRKGALFRYGIGSECERFEQRYAEHLGTSHVALTCSGTYALTAAATALGIGPGDEVLVPAHTYMATAMAVLAAGAIPVIVDVDESITIDPDAIEDAIGPRTRAVIPVHMWGAACAMDRIMEVAARHDLLVLEDVCQAIGGAYEGKKLGTIGHAGAFSFNYYKNMTAGEGGAVCTDDPAIAERARCAIDPCHFYWQGRSDQEKPFAGNGARASEIMGAMLNVQLDRLPGMIEAMRAERRQILEGTAHLGNLGLVPTPMSSADHDCATHVMFLLPSAEQAETFVSVLPSVIAGRTGRHNYTEWDQILIGEGAAHPAMNPYRMPENQACRRSYSKDMCQRSLDILNRTVMVPTHPLHSQDEIADVIHNIGIAARVALGGLSREQADIRNATPVDARKFDLKLDAAQA